MFWKKRTKKTLFGLKVDFNKVPGLPSLDVHEKALSLFVEECSKRFDKQLVHEALSHITIEWWNAIAPRPSTGELNTVVVYEDNVYSGLTIGNMCKVAWRGTIARSAFCHEILHIVSDFVFGTRDPYHLNDILWKDLEFNINNCLAKKKL